MCDSCLQDITSSSLVSHQSATLTNLKEVKKDCLEHVTESTFSMMLRVEKMFRNISDSMLMTTRNLKKVLLQKAEKHTSDYVYRTCHDIKRKLLKKYFSVRLQIFCKKMKTERKQDLEKSKTGGVLGSRSMTMRRLVKNVK